MSSRQQDSMPPEEQDTMSSVRAAMNQDPEPTAAAGADPAPRPAEAEPIPMGGGADTEIEPNDEATEADTESDSGPGKLPEIYDPLRASHLVAIGASAGGLESLERLFRAMPKRTGMAFVVIQHLSPDFKSLMNELLERYTQIPVVSVLDRARIEPDHIYLLPPGKELTADEHFLYSEVRAKDGNLFLPINTFFRAVAASWCEKAVAVVLSGTGSDGTNGALDIRDAGGVVIAESLETARFTHMAQSVINTGCVDAILAPEDIPQYLIENATHPGAARLAEQGADGASLDGVTAILELLRRAYRIDFNHYKSGTIIRRIERRLVANAANGPQTLDEYRQSLEGSPEALNKLYKDLLIGVTRLYRDPEAFAALTLKVVPDLLDRVPEDEEIRIWVCGCSTGEEAYSIAAIFLNALADRQRPALLKVLATDLHEESLQVAASGVFDDVNFADMPVDLRDQYFERIDETHWRVMPELRKTLIFSRHNLLNDPPFTHIHLVSCRNLLIYLKPSAQTRAIASFHYALTINGVMFLGASESLGDLTDEFETIDRQWKLFRKVRESRLLNTLKMPSPDLVRQRRDDSRSGSAPLQKIYDTLLTEFVPSGLLLNHEHEIMHIFGDAKNYLTPEKGRFTGLLNGMLNKELQVPVISALRNAGRQMAEVKLNGLRIHREDATERLGVRILPLHVKAIGAQYFMLVFEPEQEPRVTAPLAEPHNFNLQSEVREYVQELELELQRTRETLQSTVEELETSNEELQASNEELLASNEELQSTNEELHSVNEELYSVNAEHELKIAELNKTSSNLRNLIQSTDTATIFVDLEGRITLYTPQALEIFDLVTQDMGRPLRNFRPRINDDQLLDDIDKVIADGTPLGRYLSQDDDKSYLRRCSVMADLLGKPCGIVINYTDTTQITRSNRALDESEARFSLILQTTPNAILVLNDAFDVVIANEYAERLFGQEPGSLIGQPIQQLIREDPANPRSLEQMLSLETDQNLSQPTLMQATRIHGRSTPIEVSVGQLTLERKPYTVLVATDVTNKRESEMARERALAEAEELARTRANFLANMSHEIRTPLNGVMGFAQLGAMPSGYSNPDKAKVFFAKILETGHHLTRVVTDVLDFSKIDSNTVEVEWREFDIQALVAEIAGNFRLECEKKSLELVVDSDASATLIVNSDPTRVRQILNNLLANAVKFTDQGSVTITLRVSDREIQLSVSDTGVGISQEDMERIFMPFEQVDSSSTRRFGGTGLGLAITFRLVNLLGGQITVDSQEGKGTTFLLRLPAGAGSPAAAQEPPDLPGDLDGVRVWIAEDELNNQTVLLEMLGALKAECRLFNDGRELVEHIDQHGIDDCDIILMDIQMPRMNGFQAAEQILMNNPEFPIIGVTAHAFKKDRDRCLAVGMVDYQSKPISVARLYEVIRQHVGGSTQAADHSTSA